MYSYIITKEFLCLPSFHVRQYSTFHSILPSFSFCLNVKLPVSGINYPWKPSFLSTLQLGSLKQDFTRRVQVLAGLCSPCTRRFCWEMLSYPRISRRLCPNSMK